MKLHRFFAILAGVGLALTACNKEDEDPSMSISPEVLNFEASAASQTVSVTCNTNWKVSTTLPEWVELSVKEHAGSKSAVEVTVTVLANDGYDRSVGLVFNGGTRAKKTLTVNQKGGAKATTIADVKDMLTATTEAGNPLPENVIISGTVISSRTMNDLTSEKSLYIQDETAGINLYCVAKHELDFGDVVAVDVSGLTIKKYKELHEIDGVPLDRFSKLGNEEVKPIEVSVADLLKNKYEGMYISVKEECQVAEADLAKTWVVDGKATSINIVAKNGSTFVVRTSQYASFGSERVPQGSGKISGISSIYNDAIQLIFAQPTDYNTLTADRFDIEVEKITSTKISEILKASPGAEVTLKNATVVATAITNPTTTKNTSFLVTDADKNYLFVYDSVTPGIKAGDNVTVTGTFGSYSNVPQIGAGSTVTINSTGGSVTHPAAEDITEGFDSYTGNGHKHVSFVGTYSPNGTYHNVTVNGASTAQGSFLTPDVIDVAPFVDLPNVKFSGYYLYTTGGGKFHYIILTGVEPSTEPYLTVNPAEISAAATQTSATFTISSNVDWTCTSKTSGFSVDQDSGNGNATITVTFSENKDTQNTRTATIEVASQTGTKTVTITQAKAADPSQTVLTLTNEEIVAGIKAATDGGANGYADVTISSTSGTWTGQMCAQAKKDGTISTPFIQLRGKGGAHLLSPTFAKNVDKIELVLTADKNEGQVRELYVVPSSTSLPSGDYTNDTVATNYGMVSTTGTPGETVTINFNSDTNNFMLIVKKSATYIDSIKVYLKK